MRTPAIVSALTVAGSDSGGGAGIQADLKTFAAHGVHGLCAIAALTAQHTRAVTAVHAPPADFLRAQIDACFDDFAIGAVKLGMLAHAGLIRTVVAAIHAHAPAHVVVDPVMVATSGARLLEADALQALREHLLPCATVLAPNLPEAELLLGRRIDSRNAMEDAARALLALGPQAVLLKGGHLDDGADEVVDLYVGPGGERVLRHPRLPEAAHGTGCTLASAVAARLSQGAPPADAAEDATDYVHRALLGGYRPGRSDVRVLDHFGAMARP